MIIYLTKQISIILLSNDSLIFENFKKSISYDNTFEF